MAVEKETLKVGRKPATYAIQVEICLDPHENYYGSMGKFLRLMALFSAHSHWHIWPPLEMS